MTRRQRIIHGLLCLALGAVMLAPIAFAPVMREPTKTISATAYFGNGQ